MKTIHGRTSIGWTQDDVKQLNELMVKANDYQLLMLGKCAQQESKNRIAL